MMAAQSLSANQLYQITLADETDRDGWRDAARRACAAGIAPEQLEWKISGQAEGLDFGNQSPLPEAAGTPSLKIAKSLLKEIMTALLHSNQGRFDLAYRLVWRAQREPKVHHNPADADVKRMFVLAKSVRRDIHKMHAFVRFRKVGESDGREQFVAWFEPDHHITAAVAPFFRNRFTGMDWLIVTPECSISWDGKALSYGPGGNKSDVPKEDCVEEEWRSYYANIFNPARVKVKAMKSEMPMKYWRNLPEASLIPDLVEKAENRTREMVERTSGADQFAHRTDEDQTPNRPRFSSLTELYERLEQQHEIPTEGFADNLIRGEGPDTADLMFVGEQPGNQEDIEGRVFVGPAGKILDQAMDAAAVDRQQAFLTNTVKRFKYIKRGKRRIHQTPSVAEIDHYRWWVDQERLLIKPKIVVALGGTAAQCLTGKKITLSRYRGQLLEMGNDQKLLITVHPSYLLRIPDQAGRKIEYEKFVRDLKLAKSAV